MADKTIQVRITADNSDLKSKMGESVSETEKAMRKLMQSVATTATGMKVLGAIAEGINFNAAAEQARVSFEVMTGSAAEAEKTIKSLRDFAERTPFSFDQIQGATQTLLQFGIEADDAVETVKMLGDASGGNAERMERLANAFGKAASQGKLTGEVVQQMIEAGFNPLQVIAEKTGESMEDLRKRMSDGAISADEMQEAFRTATSEGGQFFGMLDRQSQTLTGKVSTMQDNIRASLGAITEVFTSWLKGGVDIVNALATGFLSLPQPIQAVTGAIVALGGAFLVAAGAAKGFGISLTAALGPIGLAVTAITAIGVVIASAFEGEKQRRIEEAKNQFAQLAVELGKTDDQAQKFAESAVKVDDVVKQLSIGLSKGIFESKGLEDQVATMEDWAEQTGLTADEFARIVLENKNSSEEIKNAARLMIDQRVEAERLARVEAQRAENQRIAYKEAEENFYRLNPQIRAAAEAQRLRDIETAKRAQENIDRANAYAERQTALRAAIEAINQAERQGVLSTIEAQERKIALRNREIELIIGQTELGKTLTESEIARVVQLRALNADNLSVIQQTNLALETGAEVMQETVPVQVELISQVNEELQKIEETTTSTAEATEDMTKKYEEAADRIGSAFRELFSNLTAYAQADADARIKIIDQQVKDGVKSEEQGEKEKAKIKYKADLFAWQASLGQAISNAAQAITNIWSAHGANPILAGVLTGISGAATAAQIATIATQKPVAPKLWTGTTNPIAETGAYIVGDQGPELVTLPRGAEVLNNRETMGAISGAGGAMRATIQVVMDSMIVAQKTADVFNNGLVRLEVGT